MTNPLRTGAWSLKELSKVPKNNLKVFSCFHCGGGSSMGYKLAGYDVLGGVEIDPEMMDLYKTNLNPKHSYLMGVKEFHAIANKELPKELFNLDILDGSPPCSSFSMAGSREKDWGKEKKFREGQTNQVLDDLFFDFIAIAAKLKPKVVVAENVKGMLAGNARGYVKQIFEAFEGIGYEVQLFLLDASTMGVPQKRERIFFVANRINKRIKLEFKEAEISVSKALKGVKDTGKPLTDTARVWWNKTPPGRAYSDVHPRKMYFSHKKLHPDRPALTQTASQSLLHWEEPRELSNMECKRLQTFPDDYDCKTTKAQYICGMSVPPYMMQRIATEIAVQLLKK